MARVLSEGDEGMNDEPGGARATPAAVTDQTQKTGASAPNNRDVGTSQRQTQRQTQRQGE